MLLNTYRKRGLLLLTETEVAKILRVSRQTLYLARHPDHGNQTYFTPPPHIDLDGGKVLYSVDELERYLSERAKPVLPPVRKPKRRGRKPKPATTSEWTTRPGRPRHKRTDSEAHLTTVPSPAVGKPEAAGQCAAI